MTTHIVNILKTWPFHKPFGSHSLLDWERCWPKLYDRQIVSLLICIPNRTNDLDPFVYHARWFGKLLATVLNFWEFHLCEGESIVFAFPNFSAIEIIACESKSTLLGMTSE